MKNIIILLFFALTIFSCREEYTPLVPLNEVAVINGTPKSVGELKDGNRRKASGKVSIFTNGTVSQVAFENIMVENGPNLYVYLSQEIDPKSYVDLGLLRSTKGNQVYDVPKAVKASDYKYLLIYCKRFSYLYGVAELK
ncbi:MAG: hypothetical protein CFE22_00690 [Cytophagaceae bacterium BCCC1]|nr:MAG: hypothetical protein CFE22_00690 [Cytophagaceae bacterium BCCC1]